MSTKINKLFIPFLVLLSGFVAGYTFLHWLWLTVVGDNVLPEEVASGWLPAALTGIAVLLFIRPRLSYLHLQWKGSSLVTVYSCVAWGALFVPTLIAQLYLVSAIGEFTTLDNIDEIESKPFSKYYSLNSYQLEKGLSQFHVDVYLSGRYDDTLHTNIYIAVPIYANRQSDLAKPKAWLGYTYFNSIKNNLSDAEKDERYKRFVQESEDDFNQRDLTNFTYLTRLGHSHKRVLFNKAIQKNDSFASDLLILIPSDEPFAMRSGTKGFWLITMSIISVLSWLLLVALPRLNPIMQTQFANVYLKEVRRHKLTELKHFLSLKDGFAVTLLLVYANVGVFVAMAFSGYGFMSFSGQDLISWGANYGPMTKDAQGWRLMSAIFLHGGIMHLAANMYGLFFAGAYLESLLGSWRYLVLYLLCGLVASITSLLWHQDVISVGASGAILGLFGFILTCQRHEAFYEELQAYFMNACIFVGATLAMGFVANTDNAAHIGGLLSGLLCGLLWRFYSSFETTDSRRTVTD